MNKRKKFTRMIPDDVRVEDLTIDDITCGATKCGEGFHCYSKEKTSLRKFGTERACKECGVELIDWDRVHLNDVNDSEFVFQEMKSEIIRHLFWHTPIEDDAIVEAFRRGRTGTKERAHKLLRQRIGKFNSFMDGRQTPMGKDEIVNYAQHATATCCRKCLKAWHNIDLEVPLSDEQLNFCTDLVLKYIDLRVPHLTEHPVEENTIYSILDEHYRH
ncbi:DUF4186 family protein [Flavobacterium sp. RHBU_24]|uniref:DUF4186 family protein n=1 Tax=Flavobacterium sp. RHBU_24 TaxID=3391185 RepID=UPI003984B9B1